MCVRACVSMCMCVCMHACVRARKGVNKHLSGHGIQTLMVKLDHCRCCALLAHIVMGLMIGWDEDNDQDGGDGGGSAGTSDHV